MAQTSKEQRARQGAQQDWGLGLPTLKLCPMTEVPWPKARSPFASGAPQVEGAAGTHPEEDSVINTASRWFISKRHDVTSLQEPQPAVYFWNLTFETLWKWCLDDTNSWAPLPKGALASNWRPSL